MTRKLLYFILFTLLLYLKNYGQKSNFIVTKTFDTIYVDKIDVIDIKVKTKTADKKRNYVIEEVVSFYKLDENKNYERIANTIEKKEFKDSDRYDYKRIENLHIEEYENRIKYKYIQRLTDGKVKLFSEELIDKNYVGATNSPGLPAYSSTSYKKYYISIYDSKLELINYNKEVFELNNAVYEILKIYLNGNNEITTKLDNLFLSEPSAKEKQIVNLINEYNTLVDTKKY